MRLCNLLSHHSTFGLASGIADALSSKLADQKRSATHGRCTCRACRVCGTTSSGIAPYRDVWFDRSVGLYGWMETTFPGWVDNVALVLATAVAVLCGRELVASQGGALRARDCPSWASTRRLRSGYRCCSDSPPDHTDVVVHELALGEPRYLLAMLPLLGGGAGARDARSRPRWAPVVGAAMVVLFIGHDIFSELQVIARYYG